MTTLRMPPRIARLAAALPLIAVPLLFTAGPAHAVPEPSANPCAAVTVPEGHICLPEPKYCITTPCPQYAVVPDGIGPRVFPMR
ncbi:hypothetical protein [Streptomyces sp. NPDC060035]|uniref:hypothetical protein n=1 Tax=Streptomyces sp. NPDC060035 TaxID=3347044 RepID=UPI0036CB0C9E